MRDMMKNSMENSEPNTNTSSTTTTTNNINSKRTVRRNSSSHISMSDTESTTSQPDSWHSPLRYDSPIRSDDPYHFQTQNDNKSSNKSLVPVDKYYTPQPSPGKPNLPATSQPAGGGKGWKPWPQSQKPNPDITAKGTSPVVVVGINRLARDAGVVGSGAMEGDEVVRSRGAVLKKSGRMTRRLGLVFRVFEMIACLVSFAVMAADRTQGWSGDSFDRYKEYRYCLAVNIIGFVYSAFQACDLACRLGSGNHVLSHNLRYYFEFSMDQILAYFLVSASSSAATRVNDWISNWGKDEFTLMASASIVMSFMAFLAFALSSLISGYNFYTREST